MKIIFKKTLKILIICFALIISSCEKELYEQSIIKNKSSKTEMLRGREAEKVALRLKKILESQNSLSSNEFARTISLNIGNISYDEILKIIDPYGKENYTFKIELPEDTDLKFTNLILQEKDSYTTIKLIEYNMTEQFAYEFKQHKEITRFKGTIKFTPIYSDNPCPEPEVIVHVLDIPSNSAVNNGSSGYVVPVGGGSPATPGVSIYFFLTIVTIEVPISSDSGNSSGIGNYTCPPNYHYDPAVRDCVPDAGANKIQIHNPTVQPIESEQPCSPETEIGILIPLDDCSEDFLNDLGVEQKDWMYEQQSNNSPFYWDILNFVAGDANGCSNERNFFAKEAVDAIKNEGEADLIYKVIIDSTLKKNPCLYGVYNQLGKAPTFQNYLHDFDGNFSVANLKLSTSSTLPDSVNAETSSPTNYLITITFNSNNLNRPALSIVRTFIHELIHAEIFRKLLECASMPNLNFPNYTDSQWRSFITNLRNNYPGLYDYYLRYFFNVPAGQTTSDEQHQLMAQHYRSIIVQALKEYDNSLPESTYQALAWEGLKGTVAWNILSPTEKTNINTIISNFNNTNTNCQ